MQFIVDKGTVVALTNRRCSYLREVLWEAVCDFAQASADDDADDEKGILASTKNANEVISLVSALMVSIVLSIWSSMSKEEIEATSRCNYNQNSLDVMRDILATTTSLFYSLAYSVGSLVVSSVACTSLPVFIQLLRKLVALICTAMGFFFMLYGTDKIAGQYLYLAIAKFGCAETNQGDDDRNIFWMYVEEGVWIPRGRILAVYVASFAILVLLITASMLSKCRAYRISKKKLRTIEAENDS